MVVPSVGLDVAMQSGIRLSVVAPVVIGSLAGLWGRLSRANLFALTTLA